MSLESVVFFHLLNKWDYGCHLLNKTPFFSTVCDYSDSSFLIFPTSAYFHFIICPFLEKYLPTCDTFKDLKVFFKSNWLAVLCFHILLSLVFFSFLQKKWNLFEGKVFKQSFEAIYTFQSVLLLKQCRHALVWLKS